MNIEELRKGLSPAEFEMLISRKGEVNAREVHLWGLEAEDIAATIVRLREDYEKLRRETKPTHTDLMVPPETIEVAGGWEVVDDDGTHKIVPLTSDGCRLVGDMVRRVEALTAELAATRDAWAAKNAAEIEAMRAQLHRSQAACAAMRTEWEVHAHDCPQNPSFIERATTYRAGKIVDRYTISRGDPCDCGFKPFPSEIGRDFVSLFRNLRDAASTLLATIVVRATPAAGSDVDTACKVLNDVVVEANKKLGDQ